MVLALILISFNIHQKPSMTFSLKIFPFQPHYLLDSLIILQPHYLFEFPSSLGTISFTTFLSTDYLFSLPASLSPSSSPPALQSPFLQLTFTSQPHIFLVHFLPGSVTSSFYHYFLQLSSLIFYWVVHYLLLASL